MPRSDNGRSRLGDTTSWSLIFRAQGSGHEARAALQQLFARYENTVLALIRFSGHPPAHSAQDLKQEFFARLLEDGRITTLDPARGHFRGWLRLAVRFFLGDVWKEWRRARDGNARTEPLLDHDVSHDVTPETHYVRAFVEDTLIHVLARHRAEYRNKQRFDVLQRFLPGPQLDPIELAPVARSLGMTTTALAVALYSLRKRHKELLRAAIADTMLLPQADGQGDHGPGQRQIDEEIELELRNLYRVLTDHEPLPRTEETE